MNILHSSYPVPDSENTDREEQREEGNERIIFTSHEKYIEIEPDQGKSYDIREWMRLGSSSEHISPVEK